VRDEKEVKDLLNAMVRMRKNKHRDLVDDLRLLEYGTNISVFFEKVITKILELAILDIEIFRLRWVLKKEE